jgi:hypothetical protein
MLAEHTAAANRFSYSFSFPWVRHVASLCFEIQLYYHVGLIYLRDFLLGKDPF